LHSKKHNYLLLIERYEKPTFKRPNGRLTIVCKDQLLYDGELPYINSKTNQRTYPFIKQISIKQLSSFWGMSVIERCIPIQRAYNSLKNRKHEFLSRLTSGVLTVEDGSVDVDNLEINGIEPGKIIVYRNGSTPPKFLDPGQIPEDFEKEESKLLTELNNLSCISEISTNTTLTSPIQATPSADFCINPNSSHTFTINLSVADMSNSVSLNDFSIVVNMSLLKPDSVMSVAEHETVNGLTIVENKKTKIAKNQLQRLQRKV
jgi:hypothetical protein